MSQYVIINYYSRMMNQLNVINKNQYSILDNSQNLTSLNYSFLVNKMDEEDRLKNLEEIQSRKESVDAYKDHRPQRENHIQSNTPLQPNIKFSMNFPQLNFKNMEFLEPPVQSIKAEKKQSKLIESIIKRQQPIDSITDQIHQQSSIMQGQNESETGSHFVQAQISEDSSEEIFSCTNKTKNKQPSRQYPSRSSDNFFINVIDSSKHVSTKQILSSEYSKEKYMNMDHASKQESTHSKDKQNKQFKGLASVQSEGNRNGKNIRQTKKSHEERSSVKGRKMMINFEDAERKMVESVKKVITINKNDQDILLSQPKQQNTQSIKSSYEMQIPNRMKSTYDQKINTEFNLLLNQGNFSEPDYHNVKKSAAARNFAKNNEDFEQNITEQKKQDEIKENIIEKILNIEKVFNNIRESEKQKMKKQSIQSRNTRNNPGQLKLQKRIETMKDLAPEELFQDQIDNFNTNNNRRWKEKELEMNILNELNELKQKVISIQNQTARTLTDAENYGNRNFKKQKAKNIVINSHDYNQITVKDYIKSSKISNLDYTSSIITSQEFSNMESLLSHFQYEISRETSVQDIVEMCFEIIQLFSLNIDKRSHMDLSKFKDFIQFHFEEIGIVIIWKYGGQFYIGSCKASLQEIKEKHGEGIQLLKNEHIYKGKFVKNKKNGFGMISHSHGQRYKGTWVNNSYEGKGVIIDNQSIYEGYFQKGMKQKKGAQKFFNGDIYEGEFVKNKFHGKGKYTWSNFTYYTGSFIQGYMNGYGYWKSSKGDQYEGNYLKNMKHGNGVYVQKSGKMLRGKFQFGKYVENQTNKLTISEQAELIIVQKQVFNTFKNGSAHNILKGKHYKITVEGYANRENNSNHIQKKF